MLSYDPSEVPFETRLPSWCGIETTSAGPAAAYRIAVVTSFVPISYVTSVPVTACTFDERSATVMPVVGGMKNVSVLPVARVTSDPDTFPSPVSPNTVAPTVACQADPAAENALEPVSLMSVIAFTEIVGDPCTSRTSATPLPEASLSCTTTEAASYAETTPPVTPSTDSPSRGPCSEPIVFALTRSFGNQNSKPDFVSPK